jgi:hypothetical protein
MLLLCNTSSDKLFQHPLCSVCTNPPGIVISSIHLLVALFAPESVTAFLGENQ